MYRRIWGPSTTAIHAGRRCNPTRGVTTPVFQTSTFELRERQEGAEFAAAVEPPQYCTRLGNPNACETEAVLAALERTERALLTSSGTAACAVVLDAFLRPGDHVVAPASVCQGTEQLLKRWGATKGLRITWIQDTLDHAEWEDAVQKGTALIWAETPAGPGLAVTDLAFIAGLGRKHGIRTVADNTLASPILTRPCGLGIDLSVSSATEHLGGHSDLVAGVIAGRETDVVACWNVARVTGPTLDPMAAWLLQRGLKTLYMRVRRASDNAQSLAQWLLWQPQVSRVAYPGLKDHPGHAVAAQQMVGGFGAALEFEVRGGLEAGMRFCEALEIILRAVGLGGVESLIQHPASMIPEAQARGGLSDGLLRLAVGIEDEADLKADLERGFQAATMMK
ncbi:MAG TPA: aminotransferase class I/II-fold pyridoxal phosphate-dependent enzyme [Holophaga sp.]|nr:aminotransferase class I/II-fold pyridoxal phosphate-dependent enzyme [Holophaga sp.]